MTTLALPTELLAPADPIGTALRDVFADLTPETLRAYRTTLEDFAAFMGEPSIEAAARRLFTGTHGEANQLAGRYRAHLVAQDKAANTIRSRLGALAGVVKRMRRLGIVTWKLELDRMPACEGDTFGPGTEAVNRMVAAVSQDTPLATRDSAILELLFNPALRRGTVVALDLADLDLERRRVRVTLKGGREKWKTLPGPAIDALCAWLRHRGDGAGPLFIRLDPVYGARGMGRLSGTAIYNLVQRVGERASVYTHPHALRHSGITAACEATGGDMMAVAEFAEHANMNTTKRYIDNVNDVAGQVAQRVADLRNQATAP